MSRDFSGSTVGNDFIVSSSTLSSPAPVMVTKPPIIFADDTDQEPVPEREKHTSVFGAALDFMHKYSLATFAIMVLAVGSLGIKVGAAYWTAHINVSAYLATASTSAATQPQHGPNTSVPISDLSSTLQHISNQSINLTVGSQTVPVSASTVRDWLQIVVDKSRDMAYIHVNSKAIGSSLSSLTAPYIQAPVNQVSANPTGGAMIVVVPGSNGTSVGSLASQTNQIVQNLLPANGMQLNVPLQTVPFQAVTTSAFGKLLLADVTTKQMWAYQNGNMVNSFLVTAGRPSDPTPIGEFHIWDKVTNQTMTGPGYVQPNVPWINYFDHSGDAVHGNYWRPASVFGSVNTSHGCLGVQVAPAEWIYNWAPIGTTVITYS